MRESDRGWTAHPAAGGRSGRAGRDGSFPVDAHVHFHPCFDAAAFLAGARANLRAAVGDAPPPDPSGVLLFTDANGEDGFGCVREAIATAVDDWSVGGTAETDSFVARHAGGDRVVMIAGRQIATAEGLEVLALGRAVSIRDGLPLREAVAAAREAGAVPVVPWGFGKWWGRRGRILRRALRSLPRGAVYLGDNGGRPRGAPRSALPRWADAHRCAVLPGSDPLPFARHATRAGSYGSWIPGRVSALRPAGDLRRLLDRLDASPPPFGRRASWASFARDQAAMQLRARRPGSTRAAGRGRRARSLR